MKLPYGCADQWRHVCADMRQTANLPHTRHIITDLVEFGSHMHYRDLIPLTLPWIANSWCLIECS